MDEQTSALLASLREDPQARDAVLNALLGDRFLGLPSRFDAIEETLQQLLTAQLRTQEQLGSLTQRVDGLTQRMDDLTVRIDGLAQRMDDLTVRLDALTQRMDDLTVRLDALTQRMDDLTVRVDGLTQRMDDLAEAQHRTEIAVQTLSDRFGKQLPRIDTAIGYVVERRYEERASAYFQPIAHRIRVLDRPARDDLVDDAMDDGRLTRAEARALRLADTIARGRRDGEIVHLVVEASFTVDEGDVDRAADRAGLLERLVGATIPIVAGEYIDEDAQRKAGDKGVWRVLDGSVIDPDGVAAT